MGGYFLLQAIFLTQGSKPVSLTAPAVAGRFFTTSATWEAPETVANMVLVDDAFRLRTHKHLEVSVLA